MSSSLTQAQKTSASETSIGFDFQFYYFLYRLLGIRTGESVGLELYDDVSTSLSNDRQILIQVKHTIQTNASGSHVALTTLDADLWKTISNWSKIIADENDGRKGKAEQLAFVAKTDFLLASNKTENQDNKFLNCLKKFHDGLIDFNKLKAEVENLKSKDESIKLYIKSFTDLDDQVAEAFMRNLNFELDIGNIIAKCKQVLEEAWLPESSLDTIFSQLDSRVREDCFNDILQKKKIIITYKDFRKRYRKYFDLARSPELKIKELDEASLITDDVQTHNFVKQLLAIEDVSSADTSLMIEYLRIMLRTVTNLDRWQQLGEVTKEEVDNLHREAMVKWRNEFNYHNQAGLPESENKSNGRKVLYNLRKESINWPSCNLDSSLSNGEFYHLSNIRKIGWHIDWEKLCP